ncbi:uncharacterized protein CBL_02712 [Carabus blaptoides fortunei]
MTESNETIMKKKDSELLDQDQASTSSSQQDVEQQDEKIPYPKSVFFIVSNEFCERFSFYGMRTILSLYLKNVLGYPEAGAKVLYHTFIMFVYFFPVFGAIIADSWLGKFKTIFYVSCIYAVGNVVLALAAIEPLSLPQVEISLLGLMLIALGTGGIKPCVSAFGGDQFVLPQQEMQLAKFFSMFYFAINAGSLISTLLTPVLRENVHCFGEQSCYPLAFGIPGILMVVSIVVFVAGKPLYRIKEPGGNVVVEVSKCIGHAVVQKSKNKSPEKKEHWLDYANDKYDDQLINDIKATLKVLVLYLPIPVFWALFDQQGTGWTFQASRMSGDIGFYTILPDQMQVVNPLLILAFIPLFDTCIYPLLGKCRIMRTPLQRLTVGGLLAAVSFCISAIIELQLEYTYPVLPKAGEAQLRIYNGLPCDVTIAGLPQEAEHSFILKTLGYHNNTLNFDSETMDVMYTITPGNDCPKGLTSLELPFQAQQEAMIAHFIRANDSKIEVLQIEDDVQKSGNGYPLVRTMIALDDYKNSDLSVIYKSEGLLDIELNTTDNGVKSLEKMAPGTYKLYVDDKRIDGEFTFQLGGVYSLMVDTVKNKTSQYTISQPNSVHILWLIPQYVVLTMAEIMFSVTGLEFSYSQAPVSMKSVLQAGWLLTTAFGNLLVIIIEEAGTFESQASQYFLYAGLMVGDMLIFALMAMRYKYVKKPEEEEYEEDIDMPQTDIAKQGKDNKSFENDL